MNHRRTTLVVAAALVAVPGYGAVVVSSDFEASSEGWAVYSTGNGGTTYEVDWLPNGGNPGGHISEFDPDDGGWLFTAGAEYHGDRSAAYPAQLAYDFRHAVPAGDPVDVARDVILESGDGTQIAIDIKGVPPLDEWVTLRVPIDARAPWVFVASGDPATEEDVIAVLGDLAAILVRGEYYTGGDTGFLDNVRLRTCLPDLDDDANVDFNDLLVLLASWGTPDADVNADFTTDFNDLLELLNAWGACD